MNKLTLITLTVVSVLLFSGQSYAQDVRLFVAAKDTCLSGGSNADATLYEVVPETAEAFPIGVVGFPGVTALAATPDGRMFGTANIDNNDLGIDIPALISINIRTGKGSLVGGISDDLNGCGRAPGLTYDGSTNTLFSTGEDCTQGDSLIAINTQNGVGTILGTYFPFDGGGNGLAARSDGVLFVSAEADLITVSPLDASPTFVANLDIVVQNDNNTFVNAMAFHPETGVLYGTTINQSSSESPRRSKLITIDTATGETQVIGDLPNCTDGIAFRQLQPRPIPTLSQWGLVAMAGLIGIAGLIFYRRRAAV